MTGLPAFDGVHGRTLFEHLRCDAEAASAFDRGMTAYSEQEARAIISAYDFSDVSNLIDVGGGQGALLVAILAVHPQAQGVLFEQPGVVERAREVMKQTAVAGRCTRCRAISSRRCPVAATFTYSRASSTTGTTREVAPS
jgi:tRNA A58 N-methylase Trm61